MIEVRIVERADGTLDDDAALEATEEIIKVRMRATRNTAPALRLTFHECEPHGITSGDDEGG